MSVSLEDDFEYGLNINSGDPIGQKLLQDMFKNDDINNQLKLESHNRNIRVKLDPDGLNIRRKHPHKVFLQDNLIIWSAMERFRFNHQTTIGTGDTRPAWPKNTGNSNPYYFPSNANGSIFNGDYLPIVQMNFVHQPGLNYPGMILTMEKITDQYVDFVVHQIDMSVSTPSASDHFWIGVFAIGRKGPFFD